MSTASPFAQTVPAESTGTGLAIPEISDDSEDFKPATVFTPGGSTPYLQLVRVDVERQRKTGKLDVSSEQNREFVRTYAYKIVRTRTTGEDKADKLLEDAKKLIADVTSEKKFFVAEMKKLHHEVRDPLTMWENRDKERQGAHEQALGEIYDACMFIGAPTIEALKARIERIKGHATRNWQEYQDRATSALEQAKPALETMLAKAEKAEEDRKELEANRIELKRLKDEAAERKRLDDIETARKEATAKEQQRVAMAPAPKTLWLPPSSTPAPAVIANPIMGGFLEDRKDPRPPHEGFDVAKTVDDEIYEALILIVDPDQATDLITAIKSGKIPHVQIVY